MNAFHVLLALFFLVPLVEIYLLIQVGGWIGAVPTVFLVVFTAVFGALLLRHQGFSTLERVRRSMAQGELPAAEMLEGVVLLLGGALLLTPGFFTDFLGFLCLVPGLRRICVRWFTNRYLSVRPPWAGGERSETGPTTIEGEFRREDDPNDSSR